MHLTYRKTCRICGSPALTDVIDLGKQYLQGSFIKAGKIDPPLRKIPTKLVRCDPTIDEHACGLLQMAVSVPPRILYSSYWYRSGTNRTMRDHLKSIAETAMDFIGISNSGVRVLDIGCNDGTLLSYYPDRFIRFGIDPSDIAAEVGGGIHVVQDTFPSAELRKAAGSAPFDIITSIAMFYDLEDPAGFVREVKDLLSPEGLWIFEMSYMPAMLEQNSYDTICHEHLEYYSLAVLEALLHRCGMKVVRAELNNINGGSIRCFATHAGTLKYKSHENIAALASLRRNEFDLELDTDKPYRDFQGRIDHHKQVLTQLLQDLKRSGKTIHIYGASTKGNTILQWCGIDKSLIQFAADRNPNKDGARTIGTDIQIISEEKSRSMKPDFYLVLPWHFKEEFLERERALITQGTGFIFPLPKVEIAG